MRFFGFKSVILAALALSGCANNAPLPEAPPQDALRVATHNVHYIIASRETGAWSVQDWEDRKVAQDAAFKSLDADIVAFQEMESFAHNSLNIDNFALDWLREQNPDYGVAAEGDPRSFPSTQPIFYRKARLTMRDHGWFFFSETPDVIYARTYNGSYPAFASWAAFEENGTGKLFKVFNVHFDFSSRENRRRSALLVAERIKPLIDAGETVFVIGDINAGLGSKPATIITEAGVRFTPVSGSTYHWNRGVNLTGPVDHLAATPDVARLADPVVVRRKFDGVWPSDHYPVFVDFRLP